MKSGTKQDTYREASYRIRDIGRISCFLEVTVCPSMGNISQQFWKVPAKQASRSIGDININFQVPTVPMNIDWFIL
jgi:hypothetical protein